MSDNCPSQKSVALPPMEWRIDNGLIDYPDALNLMEDKAAALAQNPDQNGLIWLLQHPALFTAGTSAKESDLINPNGLPVFKTGRGGQYTYHGPGQRIGYVVMNLNRWKADVRAYVCALEEWLILTLNEFGIVGHRRQGRVGVWVVRQRATANSPAREDKIAAIGVRLKRWVSLHGVALNLSPDLSAYKGIVPCGISDPHLGVTSFEDLGVAFTLDEVDQAMKTTFTRAFNR